LPGKHVRSAQMHHILISVSIYLYVCGDSNKLEN
jgi:hypothetical protein